ncbi:LysR substrate-binding domain-containing protein [Celeribacter marinus]|uniref:LysR substrate-binding domain-containing protein n=1 Tax=Celeribacter marinus TaxID=1397108 RepID=UPI00317C9079
MARGNNLNAILHFEAVARRGSLTVAAEELSVSPSAVSQQVKLLEQQLGIKLFRRKGRNLALTLEGEQLFQTSATALRMLSEARKNLGKARETRRLNLRVMPSFGVRWLGPRLSEFIDLCPDFDLRVDAAPDPTDFERELMDLDIRYGSGNWPAFHSAPVLQDQVLPLASPEYLATLGGLQVDPAARLNAARLIDSARAMCQWDFWVWRNGLDVTSNTKSVLMDRSSLALQLALDGKGVVLESLALAAPEVAQGRLVPVTPELPVFTFPAYWLICPPRHLNRRAVRLFTDWIAQKAVDHATMVSDLKTRLGLHDLEINAATELAHGAPD